MVKYLVRLKTFKIVNALMLWTMFFGIFSYQKSFSYVKDDATIKVQLKWKNQFQFAGFYAAQIKGFYTDNGIKVELISGGHGISVIDNLLQGKVDVAIADPGILAIKNATNSLTVLATIMQSSGYCIISLKYKNILKPSDLAGKTVLVESTQGWGIFKAILLKEGINPDSINVIDRMKDSEEILENKADAVVTYISSQPQRFLAKGYQINIIRPEEYGVDFYGDVIFSTKRFASADKGRTSAFIRATLKGWKYALAHEDEIISYILTLNDVKARGVTREQLKYEASQIRKLITPDLVEIGHTNLGRWQYMLNLFQKLGMADKNASLKNFVYAPNDNAISRWLAPVFYIASFILVIVIAVSAINMQLRKAVKAKTAELTIEIEQRKLAENLANERKAQTELILTSSKIGLWELNLSTKKTTFNAQFKNILGLTEINELDDSIFFKLIHPDDVWIVQKLIGMHQNDGEDSHMIQFRVKTATGEYIHVFSSSKLLLKNNEPFKISGVLFSIDELKKKEMEVLKVSEELTRRNNELSKFAYITSHNLRGPVVNLSSLAEMINYTALDKENLIVIENIQHSIVKLENTLNDLVEVVSLEKSSSSVLETINIKETINCVFETIEKYEHNTHIELNIETDVEELIFPKHCFISIILNLLTNSIKFKSENKKTIISIQTYKEGGYIILKMRDNGIGIDLAKNKTKIFGLYQRFNHQIEGKGIGLFTVKSQMDSLNGKIEVESELGNGTTFTLYFPQIFT